MCTLDSQHFSFLLVVVLQILHYVAAVSDGVMFVTVVGNTLVRCLLLVSPKTIPILPLMSPLTTETTWEYLFQAVGGPFYQCMAAPPVVLCDLLVETVNKLL